jgi:guanylate kinase
MNSSESSSGDVEIQPCFALIGHSGAGKSTLIQKCLDKNWPNQRRARILRKCTTRSLRFQEENDELVPMERVLFQSKVENGEFLMTYENHGEFYGLERREALSLAPNEFALISINTAAAIALKNSCAFKLYICLIEANFHTREERLKKRADSDTIQKMQSRLLHEENPQRRTVADKVLSSDRTLEETSLLFRQYIESVLNPFPRNQ